MRALSWPGLLILFGIPTLLNYIATQIAIPTLERQGYLIEWAYFLSVGGLVLLPMFVAALVLSARELQNIDRKTLFERLRFRSLSKVDWLWTVATFSLLVVSSYIVAKVLMPKFGMDATPFFFKNMPLSADNFWILYVWPVFFFFNIFGEEFLWRGYIQPRQELLNGKWTWFVHGVFWAAWHIPMGIDLIIAASPIFFILPAVVQIRKNTTIAIVVHSVFGAFGFLSISLGMVH